MLEAISLNGMGASITMYIKMILSGWGYLPLQNVHFPALASPGSGKLVSGKHAGRLAEHVAC
jgi:hypothetical protein